MSYLKNMISAMSAVTVIPSDTIYIPHPANLIAEGQADAVAVANKLTDNRASHILEIWQGTTDGADVAGELNDSTQDFTKNSTQVQANNILGAGQFIKEGNVVLNTTDNTEANVLGVKNAEQGASSTILVSNNLMTTAKAYKIAGEGFKSKQNVEVGDTVQNLSARTITTVAAVDNDTSLTLAADIFAVASQNYEIFSSNPPQGSGIVPSQAQGCLLYVGTSQEIKQDYTASAGGQDDMRFTTVRVKTVGGQIMVFDNFPVGEVLPVQVIQVFETGTEPNGFLKLIALF